MAFDQSAVLRVEVVSADRMVWEGDATSVVARTTEGDLGILVNHEPMLAALVPCGAEIVTTSGEREIVAIDGGFISVNDNRVALLSQFATLAGEISVEEAQHELTEATMLMDRDGDASEEVVRRYHRAEAQLKAAQRKQGGQV